jgi:hypothetical protein
MLDAGCWMLDEDASCWGIQTYISFKKTIFHFPYEIYHSSLIVQAFLNDQ